MVGKSNRQRSLYRLLIVALAIVVFNLAGGFVFKRFDLTQDKRFTIAGATKNMLRALDDVVYVEILLAGDELPANYRRLQQGVEEMLDEFRAISTNAVEYDFIDPLAKDNEEDLLAELKRLAGYGIFVQDLSTVDNNSSSRTRFVPAAIMHYRGNAVGVRFLPDDLQLSSDPNAVNRAMSMLEFHLADGLLKLSRTRQRAVAFIQGHAELPPVSVADLDSVLRREKYRVDYLNLGVEVFIPQSYDAIIVAQPLGRWSEEDKFKVDQYVMNGGSVLWALDALHVPMDSLRGGREFVFSEMRDLNLHDLLFQYGANLRPELIQDVNCLPIMVNTEGAREPSPKRWYFNPIFTPRNEHPISRHVDPIMSIFPGSLDTAAEPGIKKTFLLRSGQESRTIPHPVQVRINTVNLPPDPQIFNKQDIPVALLLEGSFRSFYRTAMDPAFLKVYEDSLGQAFLPEGRPTKMIVISDGDILRNDVTRDGQVIPLGMYRFLPRYRFANRDFLLNCIDYLTDDHGLLETRNREFRVRPLNQERLRAGVTGWQAKALLIPLGFLVLFGGLYNFIRLRKYRYA